MAIRKRPELLSKKGNFCPGCGHGIVLHMIAEVIEEMGLESKVVQAVGCSCNLNGCWGGKRMQAAHGRAASVATGVKAGVPDELVLTYQGDGDAYVIGLSESLNAAYRGVPITTFVINNNNFGMTGGQMSWTTLPGQITTTSKKGRIPALSGEPFKGPEIMATFENTAYIARGAVYNTAQIMKTKKMVRRAIEAQVNGEGYAMVEILCGCPTNWKMTPLEANKWIEEVVTQYYKLGIIKDKREVQ